MVKFDEIGYWSEIKLDIIRDYATEYSKIMSRQTFIKGYYYIDGFAGAGLHISRRTKEFIPGSPTNALNIEPAFSGYHFIDLDGKKIEVLRKISAESENVKVYEGNCNEILLNKVLPPIRYDKYKRALCLLDPYGLDLDWKVIYTAGQSNAIEIFLNFPVMDMNRNVLWFNPEKVAKAQIERMNAYWGDDSWKQVAYRQTRGLFDTIKEKTSNEAVAEAFRNRLKEIAGFKYVQEPIPMRNMKGATVYYLFFASQNKTGDKIVNYIFDKYKDRGRG